MELSEYSWLYLVTSQDLWHLPGPEVTPGFLTRLICSSCLFSTSMKSFMENLYLSRVSSRKKGKSIKIISKGEVDNPFGMAWIGGKMEPGFEEWRRQRSAAVVQGLSCWCLSQKNDSLGVLSLYQQFSTLSFPLRRKLILSPHLSGCAIQLPLCWSTLFYSLLFLSGIYFLPLYCITFSA